MPNMNDFNVNDYRELLAAKTVDASNGVLFADGAKIPPETNTRTILIGLGGTGMQTLDYVKGVISRRLDPSWKQYIAFIGIDSDSNEFGNMKHLRAPEDTFICTTLPGADKRLREKAWPSAWHRFVDPNTVRSVPSLQSNGANRTRYVGKIKSHDKQSGGSGVDEQIVSALTAVMGNRLAPLASTAGATRNYEVYVIGSTCGGTCSGTFLEMPALIRRGLNTNNVHINAILYLPDTLTNLDPENKAVLEANGYASLKELDYFMGLNMRDGYAEGFAYNDASAPTLELKDNEFYTLPYLVGTLNGPAFDSDQRARETIAEFLISLLGKISVPDGAPFLVDSFSSNATATQGDRLSSPVNQFLEAPGEHHEFPKRYAAIGFAEASAPRKIARAYTISKSCKASGIRPVPKEIRDTYVGTNRLVPFRDGDDLFSASEGFAKAQELVAPLKKILPMIHHSNFNMQTDLQIPEITFDEIVRGTHENAGNVAAVGRYISRNITTQEMTRIEKEISAAVSEMTGLIHNYVREEGPLAYANIYYGRFLKDKSGFGIGIREMLQNLSDGKIMENGQNFGWVTPETADSALAQQKQNILNMPTGILTKVFAAEERRNAAARWVTLYNNTVNSKIIKAKREYFLDATGKIMELIVRPMMLLAEQIKTFGNILISLSDIYQKHGGSLESYDTFQDAQDSTTSVNIASVDVASYEWLKSRADACVQAVNDKAFRNAVIDSFFAVDEDGAPNRLRWLDVPKERVKTSSNGTVKLTNENIAVPAREMFDTAISDVIGDDIDVSIQVFFAQMVANGTDVDGMALRIMQKLASTSQPLFHGTIPSNSFHRYVMYPSVLDTTPVGNDGATVGSVLRNAAQSVFPGTTIQVYGSSDASSIVMYQMAAPFEVYKLAALSQWEANYEVRISDNGTGMFLHGYSPIVKEKLEGHAKTYEQLVSWKDFPAISLYSDTITERDPVTGEISREGKLRVALRELIQEAKKLGVLYEEKDINGQYYINRVSCDNSIAEWKLDTTQVAPDEYGFLPLGKKLSEQVAMQNGKLLKDITRRVVLINGGVLAVAAPDTDLAWKNAEKVLRKHPKMCREVQQTVEKYRVFAKSILEFNTEAMEKFNPAKMFKMIQAQVLYSDAAGMWKITMKRGGDKLIANLSDASLRMLQMISARDYSMVVNGLKGYFLYSKLLTALAQPDMSGETIDDYLALAKTSLENKMNQGNMAAVEAGVEAAEFILKERAALEAKDARLEEIETNGQPWDSFLTAMRSIGISDSETIKKIREFYNRVIMSDLI